MTPLTPDVRALLDALQASQPYIAACASDDAYDDSPLAERAALQHAINVALIKRIARPPHAIAAQEPL